MSDHIGGPATKKSEDPGRKRTCRRLAGGLGEGRCDVSVRGCRERTLRARSRSPRRTYHPRPPPPDHLGPQASCDKSGVDDPSFLVERLGCSNQCSYFDVRPRDPCLSGHLGRHAVTARLAQGAPKDAKGPSLVPAACRHCKLSGMRPADNRSEVIMARQL